MARTKYPALVFLPPKIGRPPLYTTPEEMQTAVDNFFESCWTTKVVGKDEEGIAIQERVQEEPYTISGLALALGMSTESLRKYSLDQTGNLTQDEDTRRSFLAIASAAKQKVEQYAEKNLYGRYTNGARFVLGCNYKWKETSVQELTGADGKDLVPEVACEKAKKNRELLMQQCCGVTE